MRKRALPILLLAVMLGGCPGLGTAAKLMKTYRVSLASFQDAETGAFQANLESAATHSSMAAKEEKLAKIGQAVDVAILASDKQTVIAQVSNAVAIVDSLETQDIIAVTDPTRKAAIEASLGLVKNLLAQVQIALGQTKAGA